MAGWSAHSNQFCCSRKDELVISRRNLEDQSVNGGRVLFSGVIVSPLLFP